MTHITIPASIDEAITSLTGLDGLLTAKEWERAAIVWAFTHEGAPGSHWSEKRSEITTLSSRDFAKLGIAGLRSDQTVRRYRQAWQAAIGAGLARETHPGQVTELPGMAWAEAYVSERAEKGRTGSLEIPVTSDTSMAEWFDRNPDQAARVAAAATAALNVDERAGQLRRELENPQVAQRAMNDTHTRVVASDAIHDWHRAAETRVGKERSAHRQEIGVREPLHDEVHATIQAIRDLEVRYLRLGGIDDLTDRERSLIQAFSQKIKPYVDFWDAEQDTHLTDEDITSLLGGAK